MKIFIILIPYIMYDSTEGPSLSYSQKKMKKSSQKIWWFQKLLVPLHHQIKTITFKGLIKDKTLNNKEYGK